MKIFITGGTGFIGKPLVKNLKRKGHNLLVLSRQAQKSSANIKFIKGDLNGSSWQKEVKRFKPDVAVHLAWEGLPDYSAEMSTKNLFNGLKLYKFLAGIGCKFIFTAGSCAEYGLGQQSGKLSEGSPLKAKDAFSVAKNTLNFLGQEISKERGIKFVWGRIFFCYGPGQREASLIPLLINYAKGGKKPEIDDHDKKIDFIYVEDVAEAIVRILEKAKKSSVYNIGAGKPTSLSKIVKITGKLLGKEKEFEKLISHKSKAKWSDFYADISKIRKEIGWKPKTDIYDGIRNTIEHFSS